VTAATSAPHPGRKSPPSIGSLGSTFGVTRRPVVAATRQATDLTPRGFRSTHLDGVLTLKRVGVGAVLVVRNCANRGVEDQEVHDLGAIASSDTLVVGWPGEPALNQASGERDGSGPIMVTGIGETRSSGGLRGGRDEDDD